MENFKFKDVETTFDFRKLAHYDQEYLRTMTFETINERSDIRSTTERYQLLLQFTFNLELEGTSLSEEGSPLPEDTAV